MSKRIKSRADVSVIMLTALIDDDYQVLNNFLEPYDETQQLKRSATSNIDKNYMFKSITQYLDLTISGLILAQRVYAFLVNENQLQQQH